LTTDATRQDERVLGFVVAAIEYLERNDFTAITQIGLRLIRAMDGSRGVYVWLDSTAAHHAIPTKLIEMARENRCRIDIISVEDYRIKHIMNVVEVK
jgi:hypothetical protein